MKKQNTNINTENNMNTDVKEKNNLKIHEGLWYFIIFSLLGLIFEFVLYLIMSKTVGARGVYLGPLCFIYGITALIMIRFLEPLKNTKVRLFIASTVLISIIQYVFSFILECSYGAKLWDYSGITANLNGRVCLLYSIIAGLIMAIFIKYIKKHTDKIINKFKGKPAKIIDIILIVILIIEILFTIWGFIVYSRNAKETLNGRNYISNNNIVEKFENNVFTNERMGKIFPNMRITTEDGILVYVTSILEE